MKNISITVIRRLPRYYRYLREFIKNDILRISSKELAGKMGVTASQVRQDLNCFGGFGQQGYGYNVEVLYDEIGKILGVDKKIDTIFIGVGNLGHAILNHINFDKCGFNLVGLFDINKDIKGQQFDNLQVMHMDEIDEFCKINNPKVAVLAIPKEETPDVAYKLSKMGVVGFWNLSNGEIDLESPCHVVESIHISDSLMTLSQRVKNITDK